MSRQREWTAVVVGLAVLVVAALVARDGSVPGWEESLFRSVNDLPEALYPVFWPFQQLGALVIGPVVAVVALILRRYWLAIAAALATVAKLVSERIVKALVTRERPGTSIGDDINARGDVSLEGESFVSGHAILVATLAGVVTPYLPPKWRFVPWVLVAMVMVGRVYVGAHNPLDVVGGVALGVALAALINLAVDAVGGRRNRRHPRPPPVTSRQR